MERKVKQCEFILNTEKLDRIKEMLCEGYKFIEIEKELGIKDVFQYLSTHMTFFSDLSFKKVREVSW